MRNLIFIFLIFLFTGCEKEDFRSSGKKGDNEALSEKLIHSNYNWNNNRKVTICMDSPLDGMITISAVNGEVIYRGYLLNGILHEFVLNIPNEISHVLIEQSSYSKVFNIDSGRVQHSFK